MTFDIADEPSRWKEELCNSQSRPLFVNVNTEYQINSCGEQFIISLLTIRRFESQLSYCVWLIADSTLHTYTLRKANLEHGKITRKRTWHFPRATWPVGNTAAAVCFFISHSKHIRQLTFAAAYIPHLRHWSRINRVMTKCTSTSGKLSFTM